MTAWPTGGFPTARDDPSTDCDVLLLGDSITSGQDSLRPSTHSYAALLRASLRNEFGDGGSGFSPHWRTSPGGAITTGTVGEASTSTVPNGHACTVAGADGRYTQTADGTEVAVWLRRAPSGYGTARWRVDGGDWQAVDCVGTAGNIRASVSGLDPGSHVIDVEPVSGTIGVAGTEGRNQTGTRLHIMGLGGRTSGGNSFVSLTNEANATFRDNTVGRWAPHLLIINLGVNDSSASVPVATFKANLSATIDVARAARADCDLVLIANHLGKFSDHDYDGMRTALYELADTYGGLVVDLDLWARTVVTDDGPVQTARTATPNTLDDSYGRWSTYGWVRDSVHPTTVGHRALGTLLSRVVCFTEPGPGEVEYIEFGGIG